MGTATGLTHLSVRVNSGISALKERRLLKRGVEAKTVLNNYEVYARWRNVWVSDAAARRPAAQSPSVTAMWREGEQNLRLHGARCTLCNTIQYPPQRVCTICQARDQSEPIRLSDRRGTVYTYSMDYLAGSTDVPLVITVVNFEGGGQDALHDD